MIRGGFRIWLPNKEELFIPNQIVEEGEESFLKMITQDDQTDVPGGDDFYIGLCGNVIDNDATLASLTGEPSGAGGYARKAIERSAIGWPTQDVANGIRRAATSIETFTASGANFSAAFRRMFLCNVSSGTSGLLFAISGPLENSYLLEDGQSFDTRYELYLR